MGGWLALFGPWYQPTKEQPQHRQHYNWKDSTQYRLQQETKVNTEINNLPRPTTTIHDEVKQGVGERDTDAKGHIEGQDWDCCEHAGHGTIDFPLTLT